MGKTNIEWADETWPITRGCTEVSPGCRHCYAKAMAARIVRMGKGAPTKYDGLVKLVTRDVRQFKLDDGKPTGDFRTVQKTEPRWTNTARFCPEELATPLRQRKGRRIFVSSMSDLFHEDITNEQIAAVFGVMAACPQHIFMVLTKRARRMREWFEWVAAHACERGCCREDCIVGFCGRMAVQLGHLDADTVQRHFVGMSIGKTRPLPNVMLGVSCENQAAADERIPELLRTPAAARFISAEPLLSHLYLTPYLAGIPTRGTIAAAGSLHTYPAPPLNLVIAGCESGPGARPIGADAFRSLRDQCAAAGVAFFLKQAVEPDPVDQPAALLAGIRHFPPTAAGKDGSHRKPGGIIGAPYLDGVQHLSIPEVSRGR